MGGPGSFQGSVARLVIKNPARAAAEDFRLELPASHTVQALKEALQQEYAGHPDPTEQTLIYAGRVMKDSAATLSSVLQEQLDPSSPHTFHLVVKQSGKTAPPASEPQPAAPEPQPAPPAPVAAQPSQAAAPEPTEAQAAIPVAPAQAAPAPAPEQHSPGPDSSPATTAQQSTAGSSEQGQPGSSAQPAHMSTTPQPEMGPGATGGQPAQYFIMNPVMAAAYRAALAALVGVQPVAVGMDPQHAPMPFTMPMIPMPAHYPVSMTPNGDQTGQPQAFPFAPMPYAMAPMPYPFPHNFPGGQFPWQNAYPPGGPGLSGQQPPMQPAAGTPGGQAQWPAGAPPAPRQVPAQPQPQPQAEGGDGARPRAQVRVRLLRLNLKMLLQLGVFVLILYQHCSPSRFFMLLCGGLLLYITARVPIARLLRGLVVGNNPVAGGGGFLREAQVLVLGFVASLLPGWNFNPDDAAAFAAAQELMAAEAAAAAQNEREHQD